MKEWRVIIPKQNDSADMRMFVRAVDRARGTLVYSNLQLSFSTITHDLHDAISRSLEKGKNEP